MEHQEAYIMLCDSVIQQRVIDGQEIMRMSKITQLFLKLIKELKGSDLQSYRYDRLHKIA